MLNAIIQATSINIFFNVVMLLLIVAISFVSIRIFMSKKAATILPPVNENAARIFLKLKAIHLFPENSVAQIQVVTYVNGMVFQYPTTNHKRWLTISEISEKSITLPVANMYYIRFELNVKPTIKLEGGPLIVSGVSALTGSQKVQPPMSSVIPKLPISGEYQLYLLTDGSRDITLKALIFYEIYLK